MAKESEDSAIKKRNRSKSKPVKGKEAKRRRSTPKETDQSNEALLRVLTGQDNHIEHVPETEIETDGARKDGKVRGGGETGETAQEEASGGQGGGDNADTKAADTKTADGKKKVAGLRWPSAVSDAHAKKVNVTVLLENANLETVKQSGRSGGLVLLNCDDHRHILKKTNRESNDARPDITHQCLLTLMDSPLNKAGKLKVFVRTSKNVLIEIHPQTRIPRTIKRFSGLMAELLEKFKVRGTSGSSPLLKVIRNPITSHLPVGTRKIVCTYNTDNVVDMRHHAAGMGELVLQKDNGKKIAASEEEIEDHGETVNVLYVVGAMAHGKITEDWADDYICVSEYPLSAATVCSRITYAYESLFGIM